MFKIEFINFNAMQKTNPDKVFSFIGIHTYWGKMQKAFTIVILNIGFRISYFAKESV